MVNRISNKKNKKISNWLFDVCVIIVSLISMIVCFIYGRLFLLPAIFCCLYIFVYIALKPKRHIINKIIIFIALVRFAILPLTYFLNIDYLYSWHKPVLIYDYLNTEIVMIIELFFIFLGIYVADCFFKRRKLAYSSSDSNSLQKPNKNPKTNKYILFFSIGMFSFILIAIFPKLLPFLDFGNTPSNAVFLIFHICYTCLFLWMLNLCITKIKKDWLQLLCTLPIFVAYIIPTSIQLSSVSRNLLILNALIYCMFLIINFKQYKKLIIVSFILLMFIGFSALTVIKNPNNVYFDPFFLFKTIKLYSNYPMLNAYFSGPTNIDIGLKMIDNYKLHGFNYFIYDFCSNLPIVNKFFTTDTVNIYNEFIFHGIAVQEITPLSIQSLIYFGPCFFWIIPFAFSFFANLIYYSIMDEKLDLFFFYPVMYLVILLVMSQAIDLNAICMLFFIKALPILFIYCCSVLLNFFITKRFSKKKNNDNKHNIKIANKKNKSNSKTVLISYLFTLLHQLILFALPLIITPYISRVLMSHGIGQYNFSYSINYYFVILASLGFGYYAQREIAKKQGNKIEQSKIFYEIMIAKAITAILAICIYFVLILSGVFGQYNLLMLILGFNIGAVLFDTAFFLKGNEKFKIVSLVQSGVKILLSLSIFVFVKNPNDLWIYTLIMSLYSILASFAIIPFIAKDICKIPFKQLSIIKHLKPCFILFIPTICGLFYTSYLKIMIGVLTPGTVTQIIDGVQTTIKIADLESGYFAQADKLVQMALSILTSLGMVMSSRNASVLAKGEENRFERNILLVTKFTLFLSLPMAFGMSSLGNQMTLWFFGEGYEKVHYILYIYSPLIVVSGLGNIYGLQMLVSHGHDKQFMISTLIGAVISVSVGTVLIYFLSAIGAAIASLISEASVLISLMIFGKKYIDFKQTGIHFAKYFISASIMGVLLYYISCYFPSTLFASIVLVCGGVIIYFAILYFLNDSFIRTSLNKIKKIFMEAYYAN